MIYVPKYDFNSDNCLVVVDSNTLRVFSHKPIYNVEADYIDYYIHSDYISRSDSVFYPDGSVLPTCVENSKISTHYVYRIDFVNIMTLFMIIGGFIILFLTKGIKMFFRGWK